MLNKLSTENVYQFSTICRFLSRIYSKKKFFCSKNKFAHSIVSPTQIISLKRTKNGTFCVWTSFFLYFIFLSTQSIMTSILGCRLKTCCFRRFQCMNVTCNHSRYMYIYLHNMTKRVFMSVTLFLRYILFTYKIFIIHFCVCSTIYTVKMRR